MRNAEQGTNGLKFVSAEEARPGDIVAYDWGGQNDFGADGHIGFLDSTVKDGKFTALEGNNADAGQRRPAQVGGGAKVVFIRVEGDAPAGAGAASRPARPPSRRRRPRRRSRSTRRSSAARGPAPAARPSAEALALLKNKNIVLDSVGVADIKAGRIDPRVIGVLTKLSQEHKITVSCMCSDHSKFTAGGSVSNHFFGRGADIAAIDGEIVGPGSPLAREVASELSSLDPDIRPNEIGSPFAINGPGYFTDAAHQNHLHIGFKQEIPRRLEAAGRRRRRPRAAPPRRCAAAAAVPGAPARRAAAAPEVRKGSQTFLKAVTADGRRGRPQARAGNDSLAFLKAVEPPKASAAAVDPAAAAGAAAAGRRRRGASRRRRAPSTPPPSPPRRPTPTRATTRRASRSPPGWPARRRSAACRRSCR